MAGERLRIPVDDSYLAALGRCLFTFARTEWAAVWCGEKIAPGFLQAAGNKTAGQIGADFEGLAASLPQGSVYTRCLAAAKEFRRLVPLRNGIMHAQPCTAPTGEQRLTRRGNLWTIAELETAADEFAACDIELMDFFHNHLLP